MTAKKSGLRWSEEQLAAHERTRQAAKAVTPANIKARLQALGRLRDGSMNKTEARYAAHLDVLKHQGQILWYEFEGIKLRLADRTHLTMDFAVMLSNGMLQMHDVKGAKAIVEDDARAKMKVAADKYPFAFFFVYPDKQSGGWLLEEI